MIYYDYGNEEYGYSFLTGSVSTRPCFCAFPVIATEHPLCQFDEEPGIDSAIPTFQGAYDHPFFTIDKGSCSMSTEANQVLVRRYREAHDTNNLALSDEVVASSRAIMEYQGGKMVDLICKKKRFLLNWRIKYNE